MDFIVPFVGTLGFGGLVGYGVGYAAKKVTKLALIGMGVLFFAIQYLVYKGFVHGVEWGGLAAAGGHAAKSGGLLFWKIITCNVSLGAGFVAGIVLGFKKG
jgi:uncharacterized membrane protein (Fun14 family)